jgi:hypothetical protein
MRIRRSIIAPTVLTIGTIGSIVAGPVLALTATVAPAATAVTASGITPGAVWMHA